MQPVIKHNAFALQHRSKLLQRFLEPLGHLQCIGKILAAATPSTASKRGLMVQSASVRRSRPDILSDTKPTLSRSMVDEVSGDSVGARTPSGSCRAKVPSFSESDWRPT